MNKRLCAILVAFTLLLGTSVAISAYDPGGDTYPPGYDPTMIREISIQFESMIAFAQDPCGGPLPPGYCPNS